jgi:hypothetical protein
MMNFLLGLCCGIAMMLGAGYGAWRLFIWSLGG